MKFYFKEFFFKLCDYPNYILRIVKSEFTIKSIVGYLMLK